MRRLLIGFLFAVATTFARGQGSDALSPSTSPAGVGWDYVFNGVTWERFRTAPIYKNISAVVITSETTIWTPAAGKKFRLMGFCISQGVATGAVTLKDNTAGSTILLIPQNTLGQAVCVSLSVNGILSAAANNVLTATGASTETITGFIFGTEE